MVNEEMARIQREIFGRLARLIKVLAAPARLMLLQILAQGPRSVESTAKMAHLTIANTSHHLQKMAREGLVVSERQGIRKLYRIRVPQILAVWESIQELAHTLDPWMDQAEAQIAESGLRGPDSLELIHRQLISGEAVLLDVRTLAESKATPIPRAITIPQRRLSRQLVQLPKRKTIYVICRGRYCPDATHTVRYLRGRGFHAFRLRQSAFSLTQALNPRLSSAQRFPAIVRPPWNH